jgi:hypothetical protein
LTRPLSLPPRTDVLPEGARPQTAPVGYNCIRCRNEKPARPRERTGRWWPVARQAPPGIRPADLAEQGADRVVGGEDEEEVLRVSFHVAIVVIGPHFIWRSCRSTRTVRVFAGVGAVATAGGSQEDHRPAHPSTDQPPQTPAKDRLPRTYHARLVGWPLQETPQGVGG